MELDRTVAALRERFTFTPEFPPESASSGTNEPLQELLREYPALARFSTYVDFLRLTGGAHVHNREASLGIYGFGGYVVTSFDEGLFVDMERYFQFGEILYHDKPEPVFVFAFDLNAESDVVFVSPIEQSVYVLCASSFIALLDAFARGDYPNRNS